METATIITQKNDKKSSNKTCSRFATMMTPDITTVRPHNLTFPWILHEMLEEAEERGFADVVSWLSGTNYFKIHDITTFLETIMPTYFNQTCMKYFRRQLKLYCFVRQNNGYCRGSYSHPLFIRGQTHICQFIVRVQNKTKATATAAAASAPASMPQAPGLNYGVFCGGGGGGGCAEESTTRQHHQHDPEALRSAPIRTRSNTTSLSVLNFEMLQDEQLGDIIDDISDLFGRATTFQ